MICLNQTAYSGKEGNRLPLVRCAARTPAPVRAYVTFTQDSGNMCKVLDKGQPGGWALL